MSKNKVACFFLGHGVVKLSEAPHRLEYLNQKVKLRQITYTYYKFPRTK